MGSIVLIYLIVKPSQKELAITVVSRTAIDQKPLQEGEFLAANGNNLPSQFRIIIRLRI